MAPLLPPSLRRETCPDFSSVVVLFFFPGEDGIRDYKVTGVQTCALPICLWRNHCDIGVCLGIWADFQNFIHTNNPQSFSIKIVNGIVSSKPIKIVFLL